MGHIFCISPISIIHKPIFLNCSPDIGFSFNWLKFKIEMNSFSSGKSLYLITNSEGPMIFFFLFLSCGVCFLYLKKFKHLRKPALIEMNGEKPPPPTITVYEFPPIHRRISQRMIKPLLSTF